MWKYVCLRHGKSPARVKILPCFQFDSKEVRALVQETGNLHSRPLVGQMKFEIVPMIFQPRVPTIMSQTGYCPDRS